MSEHKEPIPSMIYNAAVGGHVTNSQQIIDENQNKEQSQINQEQSQFNIEVRTELNNIGDIDEHIAEAVNGEKNRAENVEENIINDITDLNSSTIKSIEKESNEIVFNDNGIQIHGDGVLRTYGKRVDVAAGSEGANLANSGKIVTCLPQPSISDGYLKNITFGFSIQKEVLLHVGNVNPITFEIIKIRYSRLVTLQAGANTTTDLSSYGIKVKKGEVVLIQIFDTRYINFVVGSTTGGFLESNYNKGLNYLIARPDIVDITFQYQIQ